LEAASVIAVRDWAFELIVKSTKQHIKIEMILMVFLFYNRYFFIFLTYLMLQFLIFHGRLRRLLNAHFL
jgi:hypothetical protein